MKWLLEFWRSSIGGKVTMAVTGLLLFLFVLMHMLGNLQFLAGPATINAYAEFLHSKPALLWVARIGLLVTFAIHVRTGIRLATQNKAARPVGYAVDATLRADWASKSMLLTGLTTLLFLAYHLAHFTLGWVHSRDHNSNNVHAMMKHSFGHPGIAIVYVAAQVLLFFHLRHGIRSLAQTLGLNHGRYTPMVGALSLLLAGAIAGGNILITLSVLLGIV